MASPANLSCYFGHDEGRPSGHSPPLTCRNDATLYEICIGTHGAKVIQNISFVPPFPFEGNVLRGGVQWRKDTASMVNVCFLPMLSAFSKTHNRKNTKQGTTKIPDKNFCSFCARFLRIGIYQAGNKSVHGSGAGF